MKRLHAALIIVVMGLFVTGFSSVLADDITSAFPQQTPVNSHLNPRTIGPRNILFTENMGQWGENVRFRAEGSGASIWFAGSSVYTVFYRQSPPEPPDPLVELQSPPGDIDYLTVRTGFVGAAGDVTAVADGSVYSHESFLFGDDPAKWITNAPTFGAVVINDLYPGIGVRYYSAGQHLEYDFLVEAGADYSTIRLRYDGVQSLSVNEIGDLVVATEWGEMVEQRPVVYQQVGNIRREIAAEFDVDSDNVFGFQLTGSYNPGLPLVIDPVLSFSTYLGGGSSSAAYGVTFDSAGNIYTTGVTSSVDFPDTNAFQGTMGGGDWDAFVTKFSTDGAAVVYSTYLGGSGDDYGYSIATGSDQSPFIVGRTLSTDFPTVNPLYAANTSGDAFVAKLSADGSSMTYGTYLGGSGSDVAWDVAVDGSDAAYIVGYTASEDYPTYGPIQDSLGGGYDAIVTKINATGTGLGFSTYLGGEMNDIGQAVVVSSSGKTYVTGYTASEDFPTAGPLQASIASADRTDLFLSRLSAVGNTLQYSTYFGGTGADLGEDIALGTDGSMYLLCRTFSSNYPLANPIQSSLRGFSDMAVTRISAAGNTVLYSTYIGGTGEETAGGLGVDDSNRMFIVGHTSSTNFPSVSAFQPDYGGGDFDAVALRLSADGSVYDYATYLGGSGSDFALDVAVGDDSHVYVAGQTGSTDFPMKRPLQGTAGGNSDVFVALITGDCLDTDEDGICDSIDNCVLVQNPFQEDNDGDDLGDSCDVCPLDPYNDDDGDGFCANEDNCPETYNPEQLDPDDDGIGTACDICPDDFDPLQEDVDDDGIGDSCDVCPNDFFNDFDGDGFCGDEDNCPGTYNPDQIDADSNGVGDVCEGCCVGLTGNVDCAPDDLVTMGDLTVLIDNLFISLAPLCCAPEANCDASVDSEITMGDLTVLIDHLFISLAPLPPCQ